ncbi:MAG: PAS domain S-box protein [Armatimonadetes bacterium]|nr:PAS domain S-box protein [Armatimonadota bacterium]
MRGVPQRARSALLAATPVAVGVPLAVWADSYWIFALAVALGFAWAGGWFLWTPGTGPLEAAGDTSPKTPAAPDPGHDGALRGLAHRLVGLRDPRRMLECLLDFVGDLEPRCCLAAAYLREEGERMELQAFQGLSSPEADRMRTADSAMLPPASGPAVIDLCEEPLADHPLLRGRFPAERVGRYCALGLGAGGGPVGLLELGLEKPDPLDPGTLELLVTASCVTGLAVGNCRLNERLAREKQFLVAVMEEMGDGVLTLDGALRITSFNQAAERITGWSRNELVGQSCAALLGTALGPLESMIEGAEQPRPLEVRVKVRDGVVKDLLMTPSRPHGEGAGGPALIVVFRDITAVREMERLRADFTATLSHELRTPLTSIKGYLHTLMHKKAASFSPEKTQSYLAIINNQADHLNRLIMDLLEAARLSSQTLEVHPRPLELRGLLDTVLSEYREAHPSYPIELECAGPLPILCDPEQIRYVLDHLLSNAIKYSIPGGRILVRCLQEQSMVSVKVKDEGVGIPFDHQEKIFEMYHRVDTGDTRTHYGVGMGLYIARKIVEAHGGSIGVESSPGYGSTFSFLLPPPGPGDVQLPGERDLEGLPVTGNP